MAGIESATWIKDFNSANPDTNDDVSQGDNHIRLMKTVLLASLPNIGHATYLEQDRLDVASGATTNIGAAASNYINITGTTGITAFDSVAAGIVRLIRFNAVLTITNSASLIVPGAANFTSAAGDHAYAVSRGSGNWTITGISRANGEAIGITDGTITLAKLANLTAATIVGRASGGGSGVPQALTGTQVAVIVDAFVGDSGAGGTKGQVPAPAAGDAGARKVLGAGGGWVTPGGVPDIILQDQKSSGTDGGNVVTAVNTRVLNTEVRDVLNICTLASNKFTLPAGTYYMRFNTSAWGCHEFQGYLYNTTDAAEVANSRGTSQYSGTTETGVSSIGCAVVTIAGSKDFELRAYVGASAGSNQTLGHGVGAGAGNELYSFVEIWRIG